MQPMNQLHMRHRLVFRSMFRNKPRSAVRVRIQQCDGLNQPHKGRRKTKTKCAAHVEMVWDGEGRLIREATVGCKWPMPTNFCAHST